MYEEVEFEEYDDEFEEEIDGDGATEPPPPPPAPPRPTVQPQLAQVLPPASKLNRLALAPSAPPVPPAYAAITPTPAKQLLITPTGTSEVDCLYQTPNWYQTPNLSWWLGVRKSGVAWGWRWHADTSDGTQ